MTRLGTLAFLLACHTDPAGKDDTAGHDLDSADSADTAEADDTADTADTADSVLDSSDSDETGCVPETEVAYDGIDQDCDGADLTDADGDGYDALVVGGDDCADADDAIHPEATDVPYDGVDQDCSGADLTDVDGDGFSSVAAGGDDCDDFVAGIHPGAAEVPYDGIDQDCSGADLTDVDEDGHDAPLVAGDDCDDANSSIHPGAAEIPYDGIDQDCSGADLTDVDEDGHDALLVAGGDCDDANSSVHSGATEIPYDGIDQDCSGADLTDVDGDGYIAAVVGGDDCDDLSASIYPGATEVPYDGIDQDCFGADLTDVDEDGYAFADDCNDADAAINPGATEIPYDGVDQDCSGADLADVDGDGYALASDCDDLDAAIHPGATEVPYDGVDQDCSGADLRDADGDGYDVDDECDDTDASIHPGAIEIPYDGVDQDCSGADLVDADGDGVDVGGDCDDADAGSHPGAIEVHGDGADNDCDSRVDEYLTCWDGSGDFLTVQEGIDGTPDGGTLEICSGTYVETVSIVDRELNVEGDDPLGVLISWDFEGDWATVVSVTGESDVRIASLGIEANGYCLYYYTSTVPVEVDMVDFRGGYGVDSDSGAAGISIERSYVSLGASRGFRLVGEALFRENIVDATGGDSFLLYPWNRATIANNLFVGGGVYIGFGPATVDGPGPHIIQNTFADNDQVRLREYVYETFTPTELVLQNNIFSAFRVVDGGEHPLYYVLWDEPDPRYEVNPRASRNLLADDGVALAEVYDWIDEAGGWVLKAGLSADAEAALLTDGVRADPEFAVGAMGNYGLGSTSPAIDAGSGDPDPDGSPADLGAFGGPNGDWWMEVPWPLP